MKKITSLVLLLGISNLVVEGQSVSRYNPNVKEIIVVCKTHFDIGYTHRVDEVVDYYRTSMIDKALDIMDSSDNVPEEQQFAWTLPGWVLYKTMEDWNGQTKERKEKLDEKFLSGKIITHALPFTFESDACEAECMARGMIFSSQLTRKYGLALSRSGKQTDVPSHGGALATVLANADVKFLHIGCNWPSAFVNTPGLFWWEGPDKSKVLTFYSTVYGTFLGRGSDWLSPIDYMLGENLIPPIEWPYKVWPAIMVTMDNSGPPTAEYIESLFNEIKEKMPDVKIRMGTMDDFYNAIIKENPEIPVVRGEMPDTWVHGIMCDPEGSRLSREVNARIASTEVLNTQLKSWGIETSPIAQDVADVYEKIALYGEHTWGGSKSISAYGKAFEELSSGEYENLEASWEDKTGYICDASERTRSLSAANMEYLTASVRRKDNSVIVYNPLPWARSGVVEVGGKTIDVKNVPPCGYRSYPIPVSSPKKTIPNMNSIENEFFKITLDPAKGIISSLIDKRTGREWVDKDVDQGLGRYMNERFTLEQSLDYTKAYQLGRAKDWMHPGLHKPGMVSEKQVPYKAVLSGNGELSVSTVGNKQMAELVMPGDISNHLVKTTLRVTLYQGEPYVDMEVTIHDKPRDNWPEADWLCLPFKINEPEFRVYRSLGVMNPATDILPGANRHLYTVGNGVTITDPDGSGVAVCPLDHPLISLGEPGCWKFTYDFIPQKPVVYVNLYNNQWNTNFRYWYPGTWSSRVRIWTLDQRKSQDENSRLFTQNAMETRNPLLVVTAGKGNRDGVLPDKQSGIQVSRSGILVTAFGQDPDGNKGTLLRVWEQAGESGRVTLRLPAGLKVTQAIPVNLRGEIKGEPVSVKSGKIEFELGAYAPASFILK